MAHAPTTAAAVANQFLTFGEREGVPIDQMKLQKLLYYAHAWYLALNDTPLFDEDVEAWPWGPVVREVYSQTRDYGRQPINGRISHMERRGNHFLDWTYVTPKGVEDAGILAFLEEVWRTHKDFSGVQLSNSTHAPNEPWTIVKQQFGSLDTKPRIPNSLIQSVFKGKLQQDVPNNAAI